MFKIFSARDVLEILSPVLTSNASISISISIKDAYALVRTATT